eukprot:2409674-Pleurochrysis_carterae.AAC.1
MLLAYRPGTAVSCHGCGGCGALATYMADSPSVATADISDTRRDQVSLESMPLVAFLCCFLPNDSVCALAQCSHSLCDAARSNDVWQPRLAVLVEDNAD